MKKYVNKKLKLQIKKIQVMELVIGSLLPSYLLTYGKCNLQILSLGISSQLFCLPYIPGFFELSLGKGSLPRAYFWGKKKVSPRSNLIMLLPATSELLKSMRAPVSVCNTCSGPTCSALWTICNKPVEVPVLKNKKKQTDK